MAEDSHCLAVILSSHLGTNDLLAGYRIPGMSPVSDMETGHDAASINLTFPSVEPKQTLPAVIFC